MGVTDNWYGLSLLDGSKLYTDMYSSNPSQWGFPSGSDGKESACNAGDLDLVPEQGRYPGEGNG